MRWQFLIGKKKRKRRDDVSGEKGEGMMQAKKRRFISFITIIIDTNLMRIACVSNSVCDCRYIIPCSPALIKSTVLQSSALLFKSTLQAHHHQPYGEITLSRTPLLYSSSLRRYSTLQVFGATLLFKSLVLLYSSSLRRYSSALLYSSSLRRYSSKCPVQRRLLAVPSSSSRSANQCLKSMQG